REVADGLQALVTGGKRPSAPSQPTGKRRGGDGAAAPTVPAASLAPLETDDRPHVGAANGSYLG
ncbi:hypothetical protein, partial [Egicoccus sp. AB-alg6-2]|uniref:hypothetical protein n=1 Tax=Egicoccus sp. AB-alg6-2 TaxID=3242692 RepID=UPI00359CF418